MADVSKIYTESTVLVLAHVVCIEAGESNIQAAEAHACGLKNIIDGVGGLDSLRFQTLTNLYCCNLMIGFVQHPPKLFVISEKWEKKVLVEASKLEDICASTKTSTLGSRFFKSAWWSDLHPVLKTTIRSLRKLILSHENTIKSGSKPFPTNGEYLILLAHHLFYLSGDTSLSPLEETLRLALLVYTGSRVWSFQGMGCLKTLVGTLEKFLRPNIGLLRDKDPQFLLWTMFVASVASHGVSDGSWLIANIADIANESSITDWRIARDTLSEYFYVFRMTDEPAKDIWETVRKQRKIRDMV
ncbi:hypothetical protein N7532_006646 [Penicillium argentinense]|uniref:Uncharacterized protein n=1 Tax=Penicillium argentinense TaxID=1131581 RepID=A0A9W9KB15_9EURO|nr:uncharacterized protein N7532_006646 [Penicillium argentinense]KAJ5099645.1 hypothetical protein N7532_006646 [Penicillium argentinense]